MGLEGIEFLQVYWRKQREHSTCRNLLAICPQPGGYTRIPGATGSNQRPKGCTLLRCLRNSRGGCTLLRWLRHIRGGCTLLRWLRNSRDGCTLLRWLRNIRGGCTVYRHRPHEPTEPGHGICTRRKVVASFVIRAIRVVLQSGCQNTNAAHRPCSLRRLVQSVYFLELFFINTTISSIP